MTELVRYEARGVTALITMDDGKANVMSPAMLRALNTAFDRAARERAVPVLTGRAKVFSAGFDLSVFRDGGPQGVYEMLKLGSELALRLLSFELPVVCACNGHAYPMGAFLMLAADARVGAEGPFRIGMNEVAIGLTVPSFALELARHRLTPAHFSRTAITGEMFTPEEAAKAGFLDEVVAPDALLLRAEAIATALARIDLGAHAATKRRARAGTIAAIRAAIDAEITMGDAAAAIG